MKDKVIWLRMEERQLVDIDRLAGEIGLNRAHTIRLLLGVGLTYVKKYGIVFSEVEHERKREV